MRAWPIDQPFTEQQAIAAPYWPGFMAGEQAIGKAWLQQTRGLWQMFGFNVRVGEGVDPPPGSSESAKRFVRATTTKRIDIVALNPDGVSLWEVKIQANLGALGQMLGYTHLWQRQHPAWPVREAGILCKYISPDTASVFEKHQMPFYVLGDVELPPLTTIGPAGAG